MDFLPCTSSKPEHGWLDRTGRAACVVALAIAGHFATARALAADSKPTNNEPAHAPQAQQVVPPDEGGVHTGIIHPPASIDPGMTKPSPNPEAFPTPVVPPPGTPGGNPQVIPK
jgi:hypothetical protein